MSSLCSFVWEFRGTLVPTAASGRTGSSSSRKALAELAKTPHELMEANREGKRMRRNPSKFNKGKTLLFTTTLLVSWWVG